MSEVKASRPDVSDHNIENSNNSFNPDQRIGHGIEGREFKDRLEHNQEIQINGTIDNTDNTQAKQQETKENSKPYRVMETTNQSLEGDKHPITGVPFVRKTVELETEFVEGVFPVFDSVFDAKLPESKYKATDYIQFKECTIQLKEAIETDPKLKARFTERQLEQIENLDPISGLTWHHNEEMGKMQLVDTDVHSKTGHDGGKEMWGGGR